MLIAAIFIVRLFYLQVIRHDYYAKAALDLQLKEYQIPAERGVILAHNGSDKTPLVLNETLYTLFADPVYVTEHEKRAVQLVEVIGGDAAELTHKLKTPDTRYVVLARKLSREQHEKIAQLKIPGIGTREQTYRTYPQGELAAQVLGFVNDEGKGQYGVEQALDEKLKGKNGELRAITDADGVPLVSNPENIITEPVRGEQLTLTLDIGMQRRVEEILKAGLEHAKSESGSAIIMDPNTGAVKAMANYPSYDPTDLARTEDIAHFANAATSSPLEVGSIMKSLLAASAIDQGVVTADTAFYNEGFVMVGDRKITDVFDTRGTQTVKSTLVESLNTGAVWILKQIGRGDINERARLTWYDYMTKHFFLGAVSGIEQAGEAAGFVPGPEENGQGINVTYANTAFGQGMTATPLQMAAAFSSIVNGGTYYQPRLVDAIKSADGRETVQEPVIRHDRVIKPEVSDQMIRLLESVVASQHISSSVQREGYSVGGKTGSAQFVNPETGAYYESRFHGTYIGFVGGDRPEYVIMVRVDDPQIKGFAGSSAAAPLFRDLTVMLMDNFGITPKQQ